MQALLASQTLIYSFFYGLWGFYCSNICKHYSQLPGSAGKRGTNAIAQVVSWFITRLTKQGLQYNHYLSMPASMVRAAIRVVRGMGVHPSKALFPFVSCGTGSNGSCHCLFSGTFLNQSLKSAGMREGSLSIPTPRVNCGRKKTELVRT